MLRVSKSGVPKKSRPMQEANRSIIYIYKPGPFKIFGTYIEDSQNNTCLLNFDMGVSKNRGTPKSSILIGFSVLT